MKSRMLRGFMATGLMVCATAVAVAQQTGKLPSFEVASIKPAAPMTQGRMMIGIGGGPGTPDPVQITCTNVSLVDLIQDAWEVKSYQVSGPGWLESARFDIAAKVPAGATKQQARLMMQNLLAERFGLVLHHSTKDASIYALLVAKGGPKLKESAPESDKSDGNAQPSEGPDRSGPGRGPMAGPVIGKDGMPQLPRGAGRRGTFMMMAPGGRMRLVSNGADLPKLVDALAMQLDRPVVDMTGLKGTYDITLDFAPDPAVMQAKMAAMGVGPPTGMAQDGGSRGPAPAAQDAGNAATIFTALPEQLGLRLEARKGPVDLLIVDSAQKTPTEN